MKTKEENIKDAIIEKDKPYFLPRAVAYIIDIILVFIITGALSLALPQDKNYDKYMEEYKTIQTDYIEKKIDRNEYVNKSKDVVYDIDYTNTLSTLTQIVILILYFVVFQFYNNGQTFGKKLMKIRVVSTKGDKLSLNQVAFRSLIANSIFINLMLVAAILFIGRNYYYFTSLVLQALDSILVIAVLVMILFRKDGKGLHDVIAGTKVVSTK